MKRLACGAELTPPNTHPSRREALVDGAVVPDLEFMNEGPESLPILVMHTGRAIDCVHSLRVDDLRGVASEVGGLAFPWYDDSSASTCSLSIAPEAGVKCTIEVILGLWNKPYTYESFILEVDDALGREGFIVERDEDDIIALGDGTTCRVMPLSELELEQTLGEIIGPLEEVVRAQIAVVEARLRAGTAGPMLVEAFDVPEHLRGPCAQYLLYFVQFLRDLGIEATAEVREEAHRVLFSVTPADGKDALQKVRDALAAYLVVPSAGDLSPVLASNPDIAMVQLQANVQHLRAQVLLASAVLQAKDATIGALELTNYQYRRQLQVGDRSGSEFGPVDSRDKPMEVARGAVILKNYEGNGITVRAPEILRRLKRFLGRAE